MGKKTKEKIDKKKLNDENVEIAKLIAKVRDKYTCQHCGEKGRGYKIHASHIINEARDHRLASDPYNIKALCYNCHINRRHKNPLEASKRFNEKRP
jgi:5-methylcytosine-specific restriction endonuclease McrA